MAISATRLSPAAQRYAAAGAVVLAVALAVWLFGRPPAPNPTVEVVAAAEAWPAGRDPGAFVTVEVPAESAALFVTPEQLAGRRLTMMVPAGTVVSAAMLADADQAAASPDAALLAVAVNISLWPAPGPAPGDTAVLAAAPGGCAAAVLAVLASADEALVVEAAPERAATLGGAVWWAWEAPPAGWPTCGAPPGEPAAGAEGR